ncbi:MAG: ammonium transporter [Chloroflexaceae bacterium]|nr:ammonium transporter [Chloroflexaceae bacterium]
MLVVFLLNGTAFAQEEAALSVDELARSINTVWVLVAAFLVFFMQAGFALLEAGATRSKNAINIMMKNLIDFIFATVAFWAIGYAFMFGEGSPFIGLNGFFLTGIEDDFAGLPVMAFWLFQLVFAGTAATIVSGAMSERTKFNAYLIYSIVITAIIYPIFGHWVWGGGWLSTIGQDLGLMAEGGFSDFAGSTVVHSVGGWCALIGAMLLGPRIGRFDKEGRVQSIPPHSMPLMTLGVFILWLGWFGFNPGSQLAAATAGDANAIALVAANTNIAAAAGALSAMIIAALHTRKADLGMTLNGVLAGLVAITAPCAVVSPFWALIIGLIGGGVIFYGSMLLEKMKIDDPVGAVPVHLMCGIWGTLSLGLFSTDSGLITTGQTGQFLSQVIGVVACGVWTAGTAFILFMAIKATVGLRVSTEEENRGLDAGKHGALAYFSEGQPYPQPLTGDDKASAMSGVSRSPAN